MTKEIVRRSGADAGRGELAGLSLPVLAWRASVALLRFFRSFLPLSLSYYVISDKLPTKNHIRIYLCWEEILPPSLKSLSQPTV